MIRLFCVAAAGLAVATVACADPFEATITNSATNTVTELGEGHMVMVVDDAQVMAAPGHPLDGAAGNCNGSVHIAPTGIDGGGHCVYAAGDGSIVIRWTSTGPGSGSWAVASGTGAFASTIGGGTYTSSEDGGTTAVTGEMTLN